MGKKNEMLEAGVEMGLLLQSDNLLKVRVIDVRVHSKQTLEYGFYNLPKVCRKGSP